MMDRLNVYFVYSTGQLMHALANGAIGWFYAVYQQPCVILLALAEAASQNKLRGLTCRI